jgi:hypothetical protein
MIGMADHDFVTIWMTTAAWVGIHSDLENVCLSAAEDGDEDRSIFASGIMDRGDHCIRRFDNSWPADDVLSPVAMTRGQWIFTLDGIRHWMGVSEQIGAVESLDAARQAVALISEQLAAADE